MHSSSILLLLPFLSLVTPHTIPQSLPRNGVIFANAANHHRRDVASVPNNHRKLIRRRKRATNANCQAPFPANSTSQASTTSAIGQGTWANSTKSHSSTSTKSAEGGEETSTSTSTSVSTTPSATSSSGSSGGSSGGALSGLLGMLFPTSVGSSWTTAPESSSALSFNSALQPLTAGHWPSEASAPDGSDSLVASFNAGMFSLKNGQGMQFYSLGNDAVNVQGAKEILFSYSVFFPEGFQFNKGGKMPGLYGGTSLDSAKSCSGGSKRNDCFSARLMWRTNGMGEFYNYFPVSATQPDGYCSTPPMSTCNPSYGDSIGRGSFYWATGSWTTVAQRLKLNDAGVSNGEQELYVNGQSVLSLTGLQMSVSEDTKLYGIMAQVFFGGSDDTWASPQDQSAYFKDWSLAVIQ